MAALVEPPFDENMRMEGRIMARALALWHGMGRGRRNALDAWPYAERGVSAPKMDRLHLLPSHRSRLPGLMRTERRIKICSETWFADEVVAESGKL